MRKIFLLLIVITGMARATNGISNHYTIDSDSQLLLENGNIRAVGHVHAVSGDMTIDAAEAIYHRENSDNIYITACGSPIKYTGKLADGKPFSGRSKKLRYTIATGELIFTDEAYVQQDGNTLTASVITYNVNTKKIAASGQDGKRVRSVIYPAQKSGTIQ